MDHIETDTKKVRIGVLVSGGGTNLQALIDAQKKGILRSGKLSVVISNNKEAYAVERAQNNGIKTCIVSKKDLGNPALVEDRIKKILEEEKIDLIILAGFMMILSKDFISGYENRIINVHPSLIPSFCGKGYYGLKVHQAVLECGVKITGATVHFVNEIPDAGKIIMQKAVEVFDTDTPEILQKRVMEEAEHILLPSAAEKISNYILKKEKK